MKDKKLQVFVSSTYTDLIEERQAAVEAILSSGNIPAGMELFSAGDESQMTVIERWIDESDVYLLILGGRYGSIDPNTGKSYTHLEYEYALKQGKPLFAVIISDNALDKKTRKSGKKVLEQDKPDLLKDFRDMVSSNLVKFWEDKKDIKLAIHETLSDFSYSKKELKGWIKGDNSINTAQLAEEIARLTKENAELRNKISYQPQSNVLYSGLTFTELKLLLQNGKVALNNINNAFDLLMFYGDKLSEEYLISSIEERDSMSVLLKLELVDRVSDLGYTFTIHGRSFYLKELANRLSESKISAYYI